MNVKTQYDKTSWMEYFYSIINANNKQEDLIKLRSSAEQKQPDGWRGAPKMGENLCKLYIRQKLNIQTIHWCQKDKWLIQREWLKNISEMFIIISNQGDENKTTLRFHLTLVRMAEINETIAKEHWKEYGKKEPSFTTGETANLHHPSGNSCGEFQQAN